MNRNNFWNTQFSNSEYDKSTEEVQHINQVLSTIAAQDIPTEKRGQVSEYIEFALLHEIIESAIKTNLEHLLDQLHELRDGR